MSVSQMITEEQLKSIKESQSKVNSILIDMGYLESRKHELAHSYAEAAKEMEGIKAELEKEYGAVNVNLEDGTFTPVEEKEE